MNNYPQYKIFGNLRKAKKKELMELRQLLFALIEEDEMSMVFDIERSPVYLDNCKRLREQIEELQTKLNEPYGE